MEYVLWIIMVVQDQGVHLTIHHPLEKYAQLQDCERALQYVYAGMEKQYPNNSEWRLECRSTK